MESDLDDIYWSLWQSQEYDPLIHGSASAFLSRFRLHDATHGKRTAAESGDSDDLKYELATSAPWIFWLKNLRSPEARVYRPISEVIEEMSSSLTGGMDDTEAQRLNQATQMILLGDSPEVRAREEERWRKTWLAMQSLSWLDGHLPITQPIFPQALDSTQFAQWWATHHHLSPSPLTLPLSWLNGLMQYHAVRLLSGILELAQDDYHLIHDIIISSIRHDDPSKWTGSARNFSTLRLEADWCQQESERLIRRFPELARVSGPRNCFALLKSEIEDSTHPFEVITWMPRK